MGNVDKPTSQKGSSIRSTSLELRLCKSDQVPREAVVQSISCYLALQPEFNNYDVLPVAVYTRLLLPHLFHHKTSYRGGFQHAQ